MPTAAPSLPPVFSVPIRWTLRVLAWLAFAIAAYLAWTAVNGSPVAGCVVGGENSCDAVLSSSWSKWISAQIPVAVLGLACYAPLASLSVLLGVKGGTHRWIITAFVLLALLAAGASIWFIALQIFAIGRPCQYCIATDICGIAIGVIATVFTIRWLNDTDYLRRSPTAPVSSNALRAAMPGAARNTPIVTRTAAPSATAAGPSLIIAATGAALLLVVFIGGQLAFPVKTYSVSQVALTDAVNLDGNANADNAAKGDVGKERVAMRIPPNDAVEKPSEETRPSLPPEVANSEDTKGESGQQPGANDASKDAHDNPNNDARADVGSQKASDKPAAVEPPTPPKSRLVKFLGGKLTLDTYKNPIIGSPEAPHVIVELVSYDCPHCRKMHPFIKQALDRYGDEVAILVMVIPLDQKCNRLVTTPAASHPGACAAAQLAVSLAALRPHNFDQFHDFLMSGDSEKPPGVDRIIPKAYTLADRDRLRALSKSRSTEKQLGGYIDLFDKLSKQSANRTSFGLPVQILGDKVMNGSVEKVDDIYKAWEENLGVKPR